MTKRMAWGGVLAALGLLLLPVTVFAHALVASSNPADGSAIPASPPAVTITFTEAPEPKLTVVHVLNDQGQAVEAGPPEMVPGHAEELRIPLRPLADGVYTVAWRTVSAVDGHVAGGAFAFGIGVAADDVVAAPSVVATPNTPPPSSLGVAGRWVFYVGVALLAGGAWLPLVGAPGRRGALLAGFGGAVAIAGLTLLTIAARSAAGAGWTEFAGTGLAKTLELQLGAVGAAVLASAITAFASGAVRRLLTALTLAGVAAALGLHALYSHAPSGAVPWLMVGAQFFHLAAFAVWIGGLAALLIWMLPPAEADRRWFLVRRFSTVAGVGIALVAVTGAVRAIDEVRSWAALFQTAFGQLVLAKTGLLAVLALLGAINRWRIVPATGKLTGLRGVGGGELAVVAGVLVASSLLTSLPPPAFVRAPVTQRTPHLVAEGHDYGTSVRLRLDVFPGYVGSNRFTASLVDYDTRRPVAAKSVALRFLPVGRSDVDESSLELTASNGAFKGRGTNLSLEGRWKVIAVVVTGTDAVEVPLDVSVRPPRAAAPSGPGGSPPITTVAVSPGLMLQTYLDPDRPGGNDVHLTFLDSKGQEANIGDGLTISAGSEGVPAGVIPLQRLGPGHFVGKADLAKGVWRFTLQVPGADGKSLAVTFREAVG